MALVLLMGLILLIGFWDARNISAASAKLFGSGSILTLASSSAPRGSDRGRVNILLVGYSADDPGHEGATLTDSIILLSLSTGNKTSYMLSIPRDLYVKIPGYGYGKINEAYNDGGMTLLKQVISSKLEMPIDYFGLINYAAVRDTVNALDGIDINISSRDPNGLYDPNISPVDGGPLKLSNGPQKLDGQTALNLTRARGDAYGSYGFGLADFDRTEHQQQVLAAIKAKLNWKLILNPQKNNRILSAGANNIKTDIPASDARSLFSLFNSIPQSKLSSLSLRSLNDVNYLSTYNTVYGQSALVPAAGIDNYSQINQALAKYNN